MRHLIKWGVIAVGVVGLLFAGLVFRFVSTTVGRGECHRKVIASRANSLKWAWQMEEWYGAESVDHSIIHFGATRKDPCDWQSTAYIDGRFELAVRVPIIIDYKNCRVEKVAGDIEIYFGEIAEIKVDETGQMSYSFEGGERGEGGWPYDAKKWELLEQSNGDISSLPWKVKNEEPHPLFDVYRRISGGESVPLEPYIEESAEEPGEGAGKDDDPFEGFP